MSRICHTHRDWYSAEDGIDELAHVRLYSTKIYQLELRTFFITTAIFILNGNDPASLAIKKLVTNEILGKWRGIHFFIMLFSPSFDWNQWHTTHVIERIGTGFE